MNVIDILTRVDAICKKHGNYDVDEHKHLNVSADTDTDAALQVQWHSTEVLAARNNLALALPDCTRAIGAPKQTEGWTTSASRTEIKFDSEEFSFMPQVDKATSDLKNTNVRLKETVNESCGFVPPEVLSKFLHQCHTAVHYSWDCCYLYNGDLSVKLSLQEGILQAHNGAQQGDVTVAELSNAEKE
ncbi:hypothetical protein RHSIM_Rhsim05G0183700 [Rhododendron simsii]|uniref:Uncharacterized protein n=1 Tax=Rhododendron simsii TaxID=118357 RepID=A0A834GWC0_RHOSS|nr:hypothetical protein RHSIM_Rhsim05G0183700 [Rhododendron simsii]